MYIEDLVFFLMRLGFRLKMEGAYLGFSYFKDSWFRAQWEGLCFLGSEVF